ncbi:MAG: DUF2959 domain-containing protein [Desulfobulbus sp.]|jgi:hypothetical protein
MRYLTVLILVSLACGLSACNTVYYNAMEKAGIHKRDIMVSRVKEARDSQNRAKEQFLTALDQFRSVVNFQGGNLEKEYNKLSATLERTEQGAKAVHDRIRAVENVSEALFREWRAELKQYSNDALRRSSQEQYNRTQRKYAELMHAMKRAESRLEPALVPLRDQVLFMKHNLNARAIAGLSGEVGTVQANVHTLVRDIEIAVQQANAFISTLQAQ